MKKAGDPIARQRFTHTSGALPGRLRAYFERNSCVRAPQIERLEEGYQAYKKGWEVRLVLEDVGELGDARRLIDAVGLRPAKPYRKGRKWIQPVYGRDAVERFTGRASRS